jgi:N-glycosylase/DNA lyase
MGVLRGFGRNVCLPLLHLDPAQPFDLEKTLSCGQVFRWERNGTSWCGVVGDRVLKLRQDGRKLRYQGAPESFIRDYFQLDLDLPPILASIDRDPLIHASLHRCHGLRIIRQPAWECLASYICATFANIPGIRHRIELLAHSFGEPVRSGGRTLYAFPTPDALAHAEDCTVRACKVGYRAPYLCETARRIQEDPAFFTRIASLGYEDAHRELLRLKGVGNKVADCVLLFAFRRYEAVPVDVWIARILSTCYGAGTGLRTYPRLQGLARELYGDFAGYAQEYLFCDRDQIIPGPSAKARTCRS